MKKILVARIEMQNDDIDKIYYIDIGKDIQKIIRMCYDPKATVKSVKVEKGKKK